MLIQQLRNATLLLTLGKHRLIVDPMLSPPGSLPGFKIFGGGRQRNPIAKLPNEADAALAQATAVVVTHEHPDHFDAAGLRWVKQRGLDVWASPIDSRSLRRKGVTVRDLEDGALGMRVEVVRSRHGRGLTAWAMGPVSGYYLAHPDEPSVYLTGDTVLTDEVLDAVRRLRPEVIVAPAGAANMGIGGDILFSVDELFELIRATKGHVVLNHLEALDHCPTRRDELKGRVAAEGLSGRVHVPDDGEELRFEPTLAPVDPPIRPPVSEAPGFQKWLTSRFAGT